MPIAPLDDLGGDADITARRGRRSRWRSPFGLARLRHHWDWLRSGYLLTPSVMVALAFVVAWGLLRVDASTHDPLDVIRWYDRAGPEKARTLLGMIAGSMITIVGVVYSIAMVNLTLASDQFGPRLIRTFLTDFGTQIVLGSFLATFIYSVVVLMAIEGTGPPEPGSADAVYTEGLSFAPIYSVGLAVGLSLVNLVLLIYFIHHVAQAIQAPNVIDSVARELERSIRRHFPEDRDPSGPSVARGDPDADLPSDFEGEAKPVLARSSGYLQVIDHGALLAAADERDFLVRLEHRPGDFVIAGGPVALAWPADRLDAEEERRIRGACVLGVQRTPPADVEFSISQLVEVAVRALAHNDPFTAINCVDRLGSAMSLLVGRKMPPRRHYGRDGQLRVIARSTRFGAIINTAFDQIRQYGLHSPALTIRLLEVIALIASRVDNLTDGAALLRQAVMIERGSRRTIDEEYDRRDIAERFQDILNHLGLQDVAVEADRWEAPRFDAR